MAVVINNNLDPFGALLHRFRKRRQLTQQQLSEAIGLHRHTISRWENGEVLPASKSIVLELVQHLDLNDQEARELLEASLTTPAPLWGVPLPRNLCFTGREDILQTLRQSLRGNQTVELTQSYALHGLGGVGKTQVAVEYAYRHALSYRAIFWIEAQTRECMLLSLQRIAKLLGFPEQALADQQQIVEVVHRWLVTHDEWLLIWDNLEDLDLPHRLLPPTRQGALLFTTRRQVLGTLAYGIEVQPMRDEEGLLLLLRRAKLLSTSASSEQMYQLAQRLPAEYAAACTMVTTLGGLPLALDQAGAYLEETGCSLTDYLHHYERQRGVLLARRGGPGGDHPHSVVATFFLATQRVEQEQPTAAAVLKACAFLYAEAIPEELFVGGAIHLGLALESLASEPIQLDKALALLRKFSLVQRSLQDRTLALHRLLQAVLCEQMSQQEQFIWLKRLIKALNALFPEVSYEVWRQCERLLPHVLTCVAAFPSYAEDQEVAQVLQKAADYLHERAQYEQAKPLLERALRIREQQLGQQHPEVAQTLNSLANLSREQGQYEQAEAWLERALHIREHTLGRHHLLVAQTLNNLGITYFQQGKYEEAETVLEQALHIREQALGEQHLCFRYSSCDPFDSDEIDS